MVHGQGRKGWVTPAAHRFGTFAELTLGNGGGGPAVKSVTGSDRFCTSPPTAQSPDREGCGSVS
ncbi:MAG TPA: hypothetical protein VGE02_09155 [Gemmatimonadales bacterium]